MLRRATLAHVSLAMGRGRRPQFPLRFGTSVIGSISSSEKRREKRRTFPPYRSLAIDPPWASASGPSSTRGVPEVRFRSNHHLETTDRPRGTGVSIGRPCHTRQKYPGPAIASSGAFRLVTI